MGKLRNKQHFDGWLPSIRPISPNSEQLWKYFEILCAAPFPFLSGLVFLFANHVFLGVFVSVSICIIVVSCFGPHSLLFETFTVSHAASFSTLSDINTRTHEQRARENWWRIKIYKLRLVSTFKLLINRWIRFNRAFYVQSDSEEKIVTSALET